MPELIEVEAYRRQAEAVVGRRIVGAPVLDPLGLRGIDPEEVRAEITGVTITSADRIGKLLLLGTDGPTIGLRFGMTGRLLVDGEAVITELEYGAAGDDPAWDRYVLELDRGALVVRDPRRLGGLQVDPDLSRLGPDATTLTADQLDAALGSSTAPVKARLLDQARVAGLGNLLVDESLWRHGIDPARRCRTVTREDRAGLAATIRATVDELSERGGSHTGDLQVARQPGGSCPRDGTPLLRRTIGGRTTWSCPRHQR